MTKLSDTQLVILSAACQRDDRQVLPLPGTLKGGAANKVVQSLIAKGLVAEVDVGPGDPVWRTGDDDRRTTLRVTDAAFAALNLDPDAAATGADGGPDAGTAVVDATPAGEGATPAAQGSDVGQDKDAGDADSGEGEEAPTAAPEPKERKVRAGTKQAQLIEMMKGPEGATIDEIVTAFGWQPHTARGAIAGALKKKLGLTVTSEKVENRGRVYRIA